MAEAPRAAACEFPFSRAAVTSGTWEWKRIRPSGDGPKPRWGHCAVAVSGDMYVMGGDDLTDSDTDILHDLYKYDPVLNEWKRCRDAPHGRCWHSGTIVVSSPVTWSWKYGDCGKCWRN